MHSKWPQTLWLTIQPPKPLQTWSPPNATTSFCHGRRIVRQFRLETHGRWRAQKEEELTLRRDFRIWPPEGFDLAELSEAVTDLDVVDIGELSNFNSSKVLPSRCPGGSTSGRIDARSMRITRRHQEYRVVKQAKGIGSSLNVNHQDN